jgi:nucleoside-diphosphate-sugar epimerase
MPTVAIKPGATIFVTGVNGLIGSYVAEQLLARGYNVRGAVRDVEKTKWLKEYLDGKAFDAKFELIAVPDMTVEGCYDDLLEGKDLSFTSGVPQPLTLHNHQVSKVSSISPHPSVAS